MKTLNRFKIIVASKGKTRSIDIDQDSCILGRASSSDVVVEDELLSRQHLKIFMQDGVIFIEELGSSNGSWLNGEKLTVGKKTIYTFGNFLKLGGPNGISVTIEDVGNIAILPNVKINAIPEKTLVSNISQFESLKVSNGIQNITVNEPKKLKKQNNLELVKDNLDHTVKFSTTNINQNLDTKKSFEDQVKKLISHESQKLRVASQKDADDIRQKSLDEKNAILQQTEKEAEKIIHESKSKAAQLIKDAEYSIILSNEKIAKNEELASKKILELKNAFDQEVARLNHITHEEKTCSQRVKSLKEDLITIKERIKNENYLIEDLKNQTANYRKNTELKIEEYALEERRVKAKIETEIIEAKAQVARIIAESEKSIIQKEMLEPEITQLKVEKDRLERDINEALINFRKTEYEIEKIKVEHTEMAQKSLEFDNQLRSSQQEIINQKEKHALIEENIKEKENNLNKKINDFELLSHKITNDAKKQASIIITQASSKAALIVKQQNDSLKNLEIQKTDFLKELADQKILKTKALAEEIEQTKEQLLLELNKIELKKSNLSNEIKWLEDNAKKKCNELIEKAKADIETQKINISLENEKIKSKFMEEIDQFEKKVVMDNQRIRDNAFREIEGMKSEAQDFCHKIKLKIQQSEKDSEATIQKETKLAEILVKESQSLIIKHREALLKTESLMDENYLHAQEKNKEIIKNAEKEAAEIRKKANEFKTSELLTINEFKKIETAKVEEIKKDLDNYNTTSLQSKVETYSISVEEFIKREMIKFRNLIVDEKMVNKTANKVGTMVADLLMDRHQISSSNTTPKVKQKNKIKFNKNIFYILIFSAIAMYLYYNPSQFKLMKETTMAIIKNL